jgi:hypothetical protein
MVDFELLRRQRGAVGEAVPPLIYDTTLSRNRRFIGRLIAALDRACTSDTIVATGGAAGGLKRLSDFVALPAGVGSSGGD